MREKKVFFFHKSNSSYEGHLPTYLNPCKDKILCYKGGKKRNSLILGIVIRYVFMESVHISD